MMKAVTISTHNGSSVHQAHNIRLESVVSKESHIVPDGHFEIWKHEPVRQAYDRLFGEAVERYNDKQKRDDRKITNYYNKVRDSEVQHPAYEMIIGIYGKDEYGNSVCSAEMGKEIMKQFVDTWSERNPNLELIGAYYHADEQGEPHVHIDYVPVAYGYSKGMDTQAGLVKALGSMGFDKQGKATAQIQWEQRENDYLDSLCRQHGLEVSHPKQENIQHLDTETYKAEKQLDKTIDTTRELMDINEGLRRERDMNEKQAQKALERKLKAFAKSYKKDSETKGYTYNRELLQEIKQLVKDRSADVEAISHTDADVQLRYQQAEEERTQAEQERIRAEQIRIQLERDKQKEDEYIKEQAKKLFDDFIAKETDGKTKNERLVDFCKQEKLPNGLSAMDKFTQQEQERMQKLKAKFEKVTKQYVNESLTSFDREI